MLGTVFHHYQHPEDPPPPSEPPEVGPKRGRGRPKGSKNKRKADDSAVTPPEDHSTSTPTGSSQQQPKKKARTVTQAVTGSAIDSDTNCLSDAGTSTRFAMEGRSTLIQPISNLASKLSRGLPSHSRSSHVVSNPPSLLPTSSVYIPHTSNVIPDTSTPTAPSQDITAAAVNPRDVISRAIAEPANNLAFSASLPSSSADGSVDFITDIDDSDGSREFHAEGIGEEDEADNDELGGEDSQPQRKHKRKPYPEWFKKHLDEFSMSSTMT
ncbi:hypothetical protein R3P38DRAFT_3221504 [Favolaschia claudopus]|uniref:Uncharacterized protein n=1 Tax=Favolaschia claudopus TaxID=2862362 RepID=A0AAW0A1W9_9AGAR